MLLPTYELLGFYSSQSILIANTTSWKYSILSGSFIFFPIISLNTCTASYLYLSESCCLIKCLLTYSILTRYSLFLPFRLIIPQFLNVNFILILMLNHWIMSNNELTYILSLLYKFKLYMKWVWWLFGMSFRQRGKCLGDKLPPWKSFLLISRVPILCSIIWRFPVPKRPYVSKDNTLYFV